MEGNYYWHKNTLIQPVSETESFIFAGVMKKTALCSILALSFAACNDHSNKHVSYFPKPGTIVAQAEEPVTDDPLNHFIFSVKVAADTNVDSGIYDIIADYGPNNAASKIVLPKGCEDARPVIRKGTQPYSYIIGFKLNNDTTFHDYFEVTSNRSSTNMKYIKAYTFQ